LTFPWLSTEFIFKIPLYPLVCIFRFPSCKIENVNALVGVNKKTKNNTDIDDIAIELKLLDSIFLQLIK
jgi:hypothetical protein